MIWMQGAAYWSLYVLSRSWHGPTLSLILTAGSLSGAVISVCVQPLDVVRTRMQADATRNALGTTLGTFRDIISEGGVR